MWYGAPILRGGCLTAALLLTAGLTEARIPAEPGSPLDLQAVQSTLDDALDASGVNGVLRDNVTQEFTALAQRAAASLGSVRAPARRARRLHDYLHRNVFRLYRDDADGLPAVLDRGEFNCVSATLVEGLLARAIGLQPVVVPGARHVFLRLDLGTRTIDVEATSPDGFEVHGDSEKARSFLLIYKLATPDEIATRGATTLLDSYEGFGKPVTLSDAAAFVWHNVAERTLARGEGRRAAEILAEGDAHHPGIGARLEDVRTFLARAFRIEFDAHRTFNAFRIAAIAARLDPANASAENRLVAAAAELVDDAADRGDLSAAEGVIDEVHALIGERSRRFERRSLPIVVAAAVRLRDWERAGCLADAYAAVEPDLAEAGRIVHWVQERRISEL